jgi:hypothetical protein
LTGGTGFIDTQMGACLSSGPKTSPHQVPKKTIEGIHGALDGVLADDSAEVLWRAVRQDPAKLHAQMQVIWDGRPAALDKENKSDRRCRTANDESGIE